MAGWTGLRPAGRPSAPELPGRGRAGPLRAGLVLCLCAALAGGCGGDGGPTDPGDDDPPDEVSVLAVAGVEQEGPVGTEAPATLTVEVRREGAGLLLGHPVSWEIAAAPGTGAEVVDADTTTGSGGRASADLRLGDAPGEHRVVASVPSGASATFSATAVERTFARLASDGGDGQSGAPGDTLPDRIVVRALDQVGDPLPGVAVAFTVARGEGAGARVFDADGETGPDGRASARVALGDRTGTYRVRAAAEGDTVAYRATAEGDAPPLLRVEDVAPVPLRADGEATVTGAGFAPEPGDVAVLVDGRSAEVLSASDSELTFRVPTFEDRCLPRRPVEVTVAVPPDTAAPAASELVPAVEPVELAPGEAVVRGGPGETGCTLLPAAAADGAEYEVVATVAPDALGTSALELVVEGRRPDGGDAAGMVAAADGPDEAAAGRRTLRPDGRAERPDWRRAQYRWDRHLRRVGARWLPEIRARAAAAPGMAGGVAPQAVPSAGDTATFGASCTGQPDVFARARTVSDGAVIYEDTVLASTGKGLSDARYDSIAARFDTLSLPVDTAYFGSPRDIDGNGRVVMLFTPAVNRLDGDYSDGFIVGYFCPVDLAGGNEAEMFYLVAPDPDGGFTAADDGELSRDFVRSIIEGTVIHELQHLINAQIGGGSAPDAPSLGGAQDVWLNEALSHVAEEVGGHAQSGAGPGQQLGPGELMADPDAFQQFYRANFLNLSRYLSSPTGGPGVVASQAGFRTRGAAWGFLRWVLDRFGGPDETRLTRAIVDAEVGNGRRAVEDAVREVTGREVEFERLLARWSAMLAVEDRSLPAGPPPDLELTSYRLRDVYAEPGFGFGSGYPLRSPAPVTEAPLHAAAELDAALFTGTARYLRLVSEEASSGTGLRLVGSDGEPAAAGLRPRVVVVRTR